MTHVSLSRIIWEGSTNVIHHTLWNFNTVATTSVANPKTNETTISMTPPRTVVVLSVILIFLPALLDCFITVKRDYARIFSTIVAADDVEGSLHKMLALLQMPA